ncbi:cytochrome P450 [Anatilimnocola floriformis]|uniref:cytochrome P450 n=1 Tax=Anatilimnocola floriformis TaxID=2948575 RepID=UPI0020C22C49|nr:cytochrome P450 [Anatilimnocola floriformis]
MSSVIYPPGPRDWCWGMSILPRLKKDFIKFYADMQAEHGDIICMRIGPYHDYTFLHPDQVKELLVTQAKHFVRFEVPIRVMAQWNRNSVIIAEGDAWIRQRRMVQPAFHPRRFAGYAASMASMIEQQLDEWSRRIEPGKATELELNQSMTDLTLHIIGRTLFGVDLRDQSKEIGRAVSILSELAVKEFMATVNLPDWLPLEEKRQKKWSMKYLDGVVRGFIRDWRQKHEDRGDLLSMLLLAVDEEGDQGTLNDEQVRDEAMTLLLAGHDTTAAGMLWCFYNLSRFPDVLQRVRAEAQRVYGDRQPTHADVTQLDYTTRVVKESLRIFPPAIGTFTRRAIHEVQIGGYTLPKNSLCRPFIYATHHDPRWFPDPERFDPERFLPEQEATRPQFAYCPFGGGPRVCIGQHFAMMEMILATSLSARRFDMAVTPGQKPIELSQNLSLRPKGGLKIQLTKPAA